MNINPYQLASIMFFFSGFCGLLYQVVWLRLAYASFGIITPVLSVVISIFMLGLSLGSWLGGRWIKALSNATHCSAIVFYALTECIIGISALIVPHQFYLGRQFLLGTGAIDSFKYFFFSGGILSVTLLPWCIFIGLTFPFMLAYLEEIGETDSRKFSRLYLFNTIGAIVGTAITALILIEIFGLHKTLFIAAVINFCISVLALAMRYIYSAQTINSPDLNLEENNDTLEYNSAPGKKSFLYFILFLTGFISMSFEVIWVRTFTPILSTLIYAFAALLTVYLLSTCLGTMFYKYHCQRKKTFPNGLLISVLPILSLLPILLNDPQFLVSISIVLLSIVPFCMLLGYLTPKLIDEISSGEPNKAGKAYALNNIGCIIGPLVASYILLPLLGAKSAIIVLVSLFLILDIFYNKNFMSPLKKAFLQATTIILLLFAAFYNVSMEEAYSFMPGSVLKRDHTATVIATGQGFDRRLFVNGIGITTLTPITKVMAHLPLAFLSHPPKSALTVCLGMGTTYRSLLSWGIEATAVELVPSVKEVLGYFISDIDEVLKNPRGKIVTDDGRRYLDRTKQKFDVITIDPPPPVQAAGSSLLYSEEFYTIIKKHLTPGGVVHQWYPVFSNADPTIMQAVARALANSFPYIRVYLPIEGSGYHFLASMTPLEAPSVQLFVSRMPQNAQEDLLEWFDTKDIFQIVKAVLAKEVSFKKLLNTDSRITIRDDQPYNEYFILRLFFN